MRAFALAFIIAVFSAGGAFAAPGDQWILGIDHLDNPAHGQFLTLSGGYSGVQSSGNPAYSGNAYRYSNGGAADGTARVYWSLTGNSVNNNTPVPTTTELYSIEFFGTPVGGSSYQPIESQFHGVSGETYPIDSAIPWNGAFGTNHQYIKSDLKNLGQWNATGPGSHAPESSAANAGPNGNYMWLTAGSWLYAKWDFSFAVDRSWSALRLTQLTPIAGPPPTGDYNHNGTVDAADYVLWRNTVGQTGANLPADGFEDGMIDEFDYFIWRENFGHTSASAASALVPQAVPEPSALAIAALLTMLASAAPRNGGMRCEWYRTQGHHRKRPCSQ
ncbi:MAG: hypothetical protein U0805_03150 [Pirellulales bacterium]